LLLSQSHGRHSTELRWCDRITTDSFLPVISSHRGLVSLPTNTPDVLNYSVILIKTTHFTPALTMHNHPPANGYDPHPIGLAHGPNDKQRINDAGGWRSDSHATSVHNSAWANNDEKHEFKDTSSRAGLALTILKNHLSRHWPYKERRTNRSPVIMTKSSLTSPAPVTSNAIFILLCGLWYTTSALSSNTGKAILTQFRYPVTLTFIQFGFVALYCLLFMSPIIRFSRVRMPTKAIVRSTLPMGMFQVGGHMFSSIAISRIPVSTVHTIKVRGV